MATAYCATSTQPGVEQLALHRRARAPSRGPSRARSAGLVDLRRGLVAVLGGEALPLDRERAVPLQVAERAEVAEHVEAVAACAPRRGPACAGGSPRSPTLAAQDLLALGRRSSRATIVEQLVVGEVRGGVQHRGGDLQLAVGIPVGERDLVARLGLHAGEHACR